MAATERLPLFGEAFWLCFHLMSIRVVNDANEVFWFTGVSWRRMLAFASRHGWSEDPSLDPKNWDESLTWNDNYEIVGGASLTALASSALADAISLGIRDDSGASSLAQELSLHVEAIRRKLPDYDPEQHAAALLSEWSRFRSFARQSSLRVDLTD